jgi:hypothetical protein
VPRETKGDLRLDALLAVDHKEHHVDDLRPSDDGLD